MPQPLDPTNQKQQILDILSQFLNKSAGAQGVVNESLEFTFDQGGNSHRVYILPSDQENFMEVSYDLDLDKQSMTGLDFQNMVLRLTEFLKFHGSPTHTTTWEIN